MRWIALVVLALASLSAAAGTLDVNLSNRSIEAKFDQPMGAADWTFGGLYNRDDKNYLLDIGLLAAGDGTVGNSRFSGGLGGKIYTVHVGDSNSNVGALALGGELRWFPGNGPFALGGYAWYAPSVVTFIDGKNFYDTGLRAEVEVFRNSFAYLGYRWTRAELEDGSQPYIDRGGFLGVMVKF
jgi:hypothetical protein